MEFSLSNWVMMSKTTQALPCKRTRYRPVLQKGNLKLLTIKDNHVFSFGKCCHSCLLAHMIACVPVLYHHPPYQHHKVDAIRNGEWSAAHQTGPSSYPSWFDPLSGVYRDIISLAVDDAGHTQEPTICSPSLAKVKYSLGEIEEEGNSYM